jgi:hypothetical protein
MTDHPAGKPTSLVRASALRLLLAVLRGIEALGKAGKDEGSRREIAEAAIAALPRPEHGCDRAE